MKIFAFDSGIGGLSAVFPLLKKYPNLSLDYLGDLANLPYGTKSPEHVIELSLNCAQSMIQKFGKADLFVVACNTASALAGEAVRELLKKNGIPYLDVLNSTVGYLSRFKAKRWIVLATSATVKSKAYELGIKHQHPQAEIHSVACPLFVPLVEDFLIEGPLVEGIVKRYLDSLNLGAGDVLVLGCTHYPYLNSAFKKLYPQVTLVDSGSALLNAVENSTKLLSCAANRIPSRNLHFSDAWSPQLLSFFLNSQLSSSDVAQSLRIQPFNF